MGCLPGSSNSERAISGRVIDYEDLAVVARKERAGNAVKHALERLLSSIGDYEDEDSGAPRSLHDKAVPYREGQWGGNCLADNAHPIGPPIPSRGDSDLPAQATTQACYAVLGSTPGSPRRRLRSHHTSSARAENPLTIAT